MSSEPHGIAFPADASGRRSTTAVGRGVVADALRPVDVTGARAAERETNWRTRYLGPFRRQVEAGLDDPRDWLAMAAAGLDPVADRMAVVRDGADAPVRTLLTDALGRRLDTVELTGTRDPAEQLAVPYRGRELAGDALRAQLARWEADGVLEPSAGRAVRAVIDNPGWLSLPGRTVAVLGAGAEMGPLPTLLRWGATVAAVDLPRPAVWEKIARSAHDGAGRLLGAGQLPLRRRRHARARVPRRRPAGPAAAVGAPRDLRRPGAGPGAQLRPAKRIQRWRAAVARAAGRTVSFHVAPSSRTTSVLKNKALAAAFAGAHRFACRDLRAGDGEHADGRAARARPEHGPGRAPPPVARRGRRRRARRLWRTGYAPRSVLGLAAVLGHTTARG